MIVDDKRREPARSVRRRVSALAGRFQIGTATVLFGATGLGGITFVILARTLGVDQFGAYMIVQSCAGFALDYAGLGAGYAIIKRVARSEHEFGSAFGQGVVLTVASALVLVPLAVLIASRFPVGTTATTLAFFFAGEIMGSRFLALGEHAFIAVRRVRAANVIKIFGAVARLAAVLSAAWFEKAGSVANWIPIQGATTFTSGVIGLGTVAVLHGLPRFERLAEVRFGLLITITLSADTIRSTADRFVLGTIAMPATVSIFASATRFVQLALLPLQAITRNSFAKFFEVGANGLPATRSFALTLLPIVALVGISASLGLFLAAGLLTRLLGHGYVDVEWVVRGLAPIVAVYGIQILLADALTGADLQRIRTLVIVVSAAIYLVVLLLLALRYGLVGCIVAAYVYQTAVTTGYLIAICGRWR